MRVSEPLKRDLLRGVGVPTFGIWVPTLIYGNGPFPCPGFSSPSFVPWCNIPVPPCSRSQKKLAATSTTIV